jgi:hypothetical protein
MAPDRRDAPSASLEERGLYNIARAVELYERLALSHQLGEFHSRPRARSRPWRDLKIDLGAWSGG